SHLELLSETHELVSLDFALEVLAGRASAGRDLCVITFDDGYRGVYQHAFPVMKELGVPGIVYVPSGYVGTERRLLHDRLWDALVRMQQRGLSPMAVGIAPAQADALRAALEGQPPFGEVIERLINQRPTGELVALAEALDDRLG